MNTQAIDVLLVEDNAGDAFLLEKQLKQANMIQFNLSHVSYLEQAIAKIAQQSFDIILLDLILPDSKGIETFLKIQDINPHIPIILLTGMNDNELAIEVVRQGAQDYLIKGQTSGELMVKAIRYAIERKQNQEKLEQNILELEGFSYMVSHDLCNPLTNIKGISSLLYQKYTKDQSNEKEKEKEKEYIEYILNSCSRMEIIIKNLMTLSQVKYSPIQIQLVDISSIVEQIVCRLQQQEPERQVEFIIAPQVMAHGDPYLLEIALENLLDNGWKYTSEKDNPCIEFGTLSLPAKNLKLKHPHPQNFINQERQLTSNQPVYFVRDNGMGFDMQQANKLFTPFQRLHSKNQFPGTGIGLAIVKRIIEGHGGEIWFDAQIDRGATFYFILGKDQDNLSQLNQ
ncbi:MAG: response regulator [Xenococcaceae cyanobacterium MO_167.B27]|nr:response regulator [Xenococcaceae cyanobacterium MO_167.B27]